jgi:daunorubicin resistance ABC transporter ATP-binding subunit
MERIAVEAQGLRKRFGDVDALLGVDLTIETGSVLGLLGPNGAGKTTTVRVLTTATLPDEGVARVLGLDVVRQPNEVRRVIGLAGQYAAVDDNLTGRENLRMIGRLTHLAPSVVRQRADELIERFDLTDAASRTARTYSGGMRRRLDLAAALVDRPRVLFLDEPTTGLDPRSRQELWSLIGELVDQGATVLLTTQYLEEADQLADRVAVVDEGRIIAEGTPAQLKEGIGRTMLELEFTDEWACGRALAMLERHPVRRRGTELEITLDTPRAVIEVLGGLDSRGIEPERLAVRGPSLDDVFLSLTGHRATADEPGSDEALDREIAESPITEGAFA